MPQNQSVLEVDMTEPQFGQARRSVISTQPRQKEEMSKRAISLLALLLAKPLAILVRCMQRTLSLLLAGFIALILGRRKTSQRQKLPAEQHLELDRATDLEEHFLSMASHELKTPMTTIRGEAQLMLRRLERQKELSSELATIRAALEKIDGQTRRLNAIVDDILELNTIRAGKIELRLRPCNLVDICRDAVEVHRLLTGRTIELEMSASSVTLLADSDRLSQVAVNLVDNALKYSPEGTVVRVAVGQYDDIALIQVHDEGPGIPEDQQALIFEPFYRAPDVQSSSQSGLGLGLAICKEIVERHGGHIGCSSQMGKGSVFFVGLPLR
jgi:signal transduction histidine kinase